jgi:hypothetical protein
MTTHTASCFCGSVELSVTGAPEVMGYCHCASCRHWSAGPVNAFTLWKPDAVKVSSGAAFVGTFNLTPNSARKWCTKCGGHLYAEHPGMGLTDVFAALLPTLDFKPVFHVNYVEAVLPIRDGLPKFKDFPKEVGGSGDTLPE